MVAHLTEARSSSACPPGAAADPAVPPLINTDEGQKAQRNGNMFIAVFRKRLDLLAPREPPPLLGNDVAARAAAAAGYLQRRAASVAA